MIKVGGSLLGRADLRHRLRDWLREQPAGEKLMIVGGGEVVNAVRRLDGVAPRDAATVHWECVRLLDVTHSWVRDWFPEWETLETATAFQKQLQLGFDRRQPTLVRVGAFYGPAHDAALPHDWRTTTDAMAALLAVITDADRLVLLKSCEIPPEGDLTAWSKRGLVDEAVLQIDLGETEVELQSLFSPGTARPDDSREC